MPKTTELDDKFVLLHRYRRNKHQIKLSKNQQNIFFTRINNESIDKQAFYYEEISSKI